jgi:hypothetical protein
MRDWLEDYAFSLIVTAILTGFLALCIWGTVSDSNNYDRTFSIACQKAGGSAIIGSTDLCMSKTGIVVFQQNDN